MISRRDFITKAALTGALVPFIGCASNSNKLRILVLGGRSYIGPSIVRSLTENGHTVELFNRGITNPDMFSQLKHYQGDRLRGKIGYDNLLDHSWDVVIDTWPDNPSLVENACSLLRNKTRLYVFISSIAVYRSFKVPNQSEGSPLTEGDQYEEGYYNLNKVLCENAVKSSFPNNHIIFRPGSIIGERDPGPFVTNIIRRISQREDIIVPDSNDPVQFIDVKDMALFLTQCIENERFGTYNIVTPRDYVGYRDFIQKGVNTLNPSIKVHLVSPDSIINTMKLEPFIDMPLWIPIETDPEPGFFQISSQKAVDAGLRFRNLDETFKDGYKTLNSSFTYFNEDGGEWGINDQREDRLIREYLA